MQKPWILAIAAVMVLFSACDTLNEEVPLISIGGGVFGLNGEEGTALEGGFSSAGKAGSPAAMGYFELTKQFDDADAGDFAELMELTCDLGVAVETGDVGLRLVNIDASAWPVSLTAVYFALDFSISDANHLGPDALGPPGGLPLAVSPGAVVFSRGPDCSPGSAQCAYYVSSGDVERLAELFPIASTDEAWLDHVSDIVFRTGSDPNTRNTLHVELDVEFTNPASDFDGFEGVIRVGEYETQIRPVIF